jgi:hypothetical protein
MNKLPKQMFRVKSFFEGLEHEFFYDEGAALENAEMWAKRAINHINEYKDSYEYRQPKNVPHEINFEDKWGVKRYYTTLQGNGDPVILAKVEEMKIN